MRTSARKVIVTGGTKGLGRALSLAFAERGDAVLALYAHDEDAARELRSEVAARGLAVDVVRHDVAADPAALPEIAAGTTLTLINNAWPAFEPRPFHLLTWEEVQKGIDTGLRGAFRMTQFVLPRMIRAKGGTIINVLSTGVEPTVAKGFGGYAVAKWGLSAMSSAVAAEYGARGIRAFCVSPPYMKTAMTAGWDARMRDALAGGSEPPSAETVARAIIRLADESEGGGGVIHRVP